MKLLLKILSQISQTASPPFLPLPPLEDDADDDALEEEEAIVGDATLTSPLMLLRSSSLTMEATVDDVGLDAVDDDMLSI